MQTSQPQAYTPQTIAFPQSRFFKTFYNTSKFKVSLPGLLPSGILPNLDLRGLAASWQIATTLKNQEETARGLSRDAGDDSAAESDAESDASSLSDYGIPSSDPMGRFTVTALPLTNQPPSSSWHSPPQQPPQQLQYQYQQQHQQQQQQARGSLDTEHVDDSAHSGRLMPELESEQQTGMRPDLAAMRGRADSAHEMLVSCLQTFRS